MFPLSAFLLCHFEIETESWGRIQNYSKQAPLAFSSHFLGENSLRKLSVSLVVLTSNSRTAAISQDLIPGHLSVTRARLPAHTLPLGLCYTAPRLLTEGGFY